MMKKNGITLILVGFVAGVAGSFSTFIFNKTTRNNFENKAFNPKQQKQLIRKGKIEIEGMEPDGSKRYLSTYGY